jgi:AcrR family transcriptional regulator
VLFWERGFHAVALADILATSGVPKGSFHYYFASKNALAAEVLENYRLQIGAAFDALFSPGAWPETVAALYRLLEDLVVPAGGAGVSMAQMGHGFVTAGDKLASRVVEILAFVERSFEKALTGFFPGKPGAGSTAVLVVALCMGHLARMLIYRDESIPVQLCEDLLDLPW